MSIQAKLKNRVYTNWQVRELDRIAIEEHGIAGYTLMQRAGQALLMCIQKQWPSAKSLSIVCGAGNNAGDGYVLARLALEQQEQHYQVHVCALVSPQQLSGDAAQAYQDYLAIGGQVTAFNQVIEPADVIVDALLGTGLNRTVEGDYAQAISLMNTLPCPILSVDIPSGLNADTGCIHGLAVKADCTVSFIGLKQGLLTGQARDYVGELFQEDLAVPDCVYQKVSTPKYILQASDVVQAFPPRPRVAHKGHFGHSLLVGGAVGMRGAIQLAAEAALRTGSGLVSVATASEHAAWLNVARPELMVHGMTNAQALRTLIQGKSAVGIGPGLGRSTWARSLLNTVLNSELNLVLDADALNMLATINWQCSRWILTPHPAEAARLLACSTAEVEQDRVAAVSRLQQQYGGVIVLKGAGTLVASQTEIAFCTAGNPGMASGGMGDVLTGIITSLLAQGFDLMNAAKLGVQIHAQAGDSAAKVGERGLIASDLIGVLPSLINSTVKRDRICSP